MGKQKYTAKEKKVSRMTRNGLVEENLATKETRTYALMSTKPDEIQT